MTWYFLFRLARLALLVLVVLCITHFAGHRTLGCWSVWLAVNSRDDRRLYLMDPTACKILSYEIEGE